MMRRAQAFAALAACLFLASCESLMDPRAWGNGGGGAADARPSSSPGKRPAESPAAAAPVGDSAGPKIAQRENSEPTFSSDQGPQALARASSSGPGAGALVLKAAMARVEKGTILKGSCFSFAEAVYADSGFPAAKVRKIFSGKEKGPFADPALIEPGDWIQFTHMYSASLGHSAIFVAWLDFENHTALTIDYPGNERAEPGRYRVADLYKVWGVNRAGD